MLGIVRGESPFCWVLDFTSSACFSGISEGRCAVYVIRCVLKLMQNLDVFIVLEMEKRF